MSISIQNMEAWAKFCSMDRALSSLHMVNEVA